MTVATEKLKAETERFQLVRMTHARLMSSMTSLGSNLYRYSYGQAIAFASASYSVVTLTQVFVTPANNGEYLVDESTGTITFYLTAAPTATFPVVLRYLFFSTDVTRYVSQDPVTGGTTREWQPLLKGGVSVTQSIEDFGKSLINFDASSIEVYNGDCWLQPYFKTLTDTFYRKEVVVWQGIASAGQSFSASNVQRLYTGTVQSAEIGTDSVTFSTYDKRMLLDGAALCGVANTDYAYGGVSATTVYSGHKDRPRPSILAASSWVSIRIEVASTGSVTINSPIPADGLKAGCTNYSTSITTSTNREWRVGRMLGSAAPTQTFGSISTIAVDLYFVHFKFASSTYTNLRVGDTISFTYSGVTYYREIVWVGSYLNAGVFYDVACRRKDYAGTDVNAAISAAGTTMNALKAFSLFITGGNNVLVTVLPGDPIHLRQGLDYTLSVTADGTWYTYTVTLANNFEANVSLGATLDPGTHDIFYYMTSTSSFTHGTIAQFLLQQAGLTVDSASITAANLVSSDTINYQIPAIDGGSDVPTYREVIEAILLSMVSYVYVNADGSVSYKLYADPSSTDTRDAYSISRPTASVEYRDTLYWVNYDNPHWPINRSTGRPYLTSYTLAAGSTKYRDLNSGASDIAALNHCLAEGSPSQGTNITSRATHTRVIYSFESASLDLDSAIGTQILLQHEQVLDGTGSVSLLIIGLTIDLNSTQVRATVL